MKKSIFSLISILFSLEICSQDCNLYYPNHSNANLEYSTYVNNKLTATYSCKYTFENKGLDTIAVTVNSELFDLKGKSLLSITSTNMCVKGFYYMSNIGSMKFTKTIDGLLMTQGGNIWQEWPTTLNIGDTLRGYKGQVTIYFKDTKPEDLEVIISTIYNGVVGYAWTMLEWALTPSISVKTETNVSDRRVEAIEDIITPIGTFKCYKITSSSSTTTLTPGNKKNSSVKVTKSRNISWFTTNIGLVKSENYDIDGNLTGNSLIKAME